MRFIQYLVKLWISVGVIIAVTGTGFGVDVPEDKLKANIGVALPLRTRARWIVDADDQVVKLGCVNWYGAHMEAYVVNGLEVQAVDTIADNIVSLGFNCVRLPFSTELLVSNPIITNSTTVAANLELLEMDAVSVLDKVIQSLTSKGLFVILNNHIGKAQWCCSTTDGEGLWYSKSFSTEQFESSWLDLAAKYADNKFVIGADLRNELRLANSTIPTWGTNKPATDWALEATKLGNKLLKTAHD
jgi:endoglucanase